MNYYSREKITRGKELLLAGIYLLLAGTIYYSRERNIGSIWHQRASVVIRQLKAPYLLVVIVGILFSSLFHICQQSTIMIWCNSEWIIKNKWQWTVSFRAMTPCHLGRSHLRQIFFFDISWLSWRKQFEYSDTRHVVTQMPIVLIFQLYGKTAACISMNTNHNVV